jgi:putative ABC transport system permease protein
MKAHDLVELAARNLSESLLRNSLTTLGIAVGVASLVAMLSLGVGLQQLAGRRLARSGLFDTILVFPKRGFRGLGRAERPTNPQPGESRVLDENARRELERVPNVVEAYPEIRFATETRFAGTPHFTIVAGLPASARSDDAFDGMQGHFFSSPEAEEAIVQVELARELDKDPASVIGKEIVLRYAERQPLPQQTASRKPPGPPAARLPARTAGGPDGQGRTGNGDEEDWGFSVVRREKKLRIVGLIESEPYAGITNFARGRLFIPIPFAEKLNPVQSSSLRDVVRAATSAATYPAVVVRMSAPLQVSAAEEAIQRMGFGTFSFLDATRRLRRFFAIVDLFLGIFGSLALAVASLGIINTLVMAILERRREIGILKALGASDRDVKQLFFAEAGVMGLFGGTLGVAMGWAVGRAINVGVNLYLQRQELAPENIWSVPWWLAAGGIAFAVLVSLMAGLYPASRAAKLDPVQALRYE